MGYRSRRNIYSNNNVVYTANENYANAFQQSGVEYEPRNPSKKFTDDLDLIKRQAFIQKDTIIRINDSIWYMIAFSCLCIFVIFVELSKAFLSNTQRQLLHVFGVFVFLSVITLIFIHF